MSLDTDLDTMFADADVLVVVDDWKGAFDTKPLMYGGRTFTRECRGIYQTLCDSKASHWHASGSRAEHQFLFTATNCGELLELLQGHKSQFFSLIAPSSATFAPQSSTTANWRALMAGAPELAELWNVKAPHAQFLFWFLEFWVDWAQAHLPPETRVRVIVDQQDWLSSRRYAPVESMTGLAYLAATSHGPNEVEVMCLVDKSATAVSPILPLLGLVDSEVWLYGRLLSRRAADGRTVHEHYLERGRATGRLAAGHVSTGETLGDIFAKDHLDHTELWNYLTKVFPNHISLLPKSDS